ncbi:hypothetical protein A0H81_13903 [Grifola frondosa]|uniref:Uncharacterized protein n=1 Tax=Grifola frondosa TaxID=5627 RepID=A0A1C7LMY4_GRIFR|nr:hypothetical protein A0H81_13903 [Grifola frondosa]
MKCALVWAVFVVEWSFAPGSRMNSASIRTEYQSHSFMMATIFRARCGPIHPVRGYWRTRPNLRSLSEPFAISEREDVVWHPFKLGPFDGSPSDTLIDYASPSEPVSKHRPTTHSPGNSLPPPFNSDEDASAAESSWTSAGGYAFTIPTRQHLTFSMPCDDDFGVQDPTLFSIDISSPIVFSLSSHSV